MSKNRLISVVGLVLAGGAGCGNGCASPQEIECIQDSNCASKSAANV